MTVNGQMQVFRISERRGIGNTRTADFDIESDFLSERDRNVRRFAL